SRRKATRAADGCRVRTTAPCGCISLERQASAGGHGRATRTLFARQREQEFDDPIDIQYTSGTTGLPKGATLSHHMILNTTLDFGEYLRFSAQDRLCVTLPFYHCGGMVYSALLCYTRGATLVIPAPVFDADTTLRTIEAERCTALH